MYKTIALPKLNKLNPTVTSTIIKLVEETGELAEVFYKRHMSGKSGEEISPEVCLILKMVIMCGQFARSVGKHKGLNGERIIESGPDLSDEIAELTVVMAKYQPELSPEIEIDDSNYLKELTKELLDVAQCSVSMSFCLEKLGLNIKKALKTHIQKMRDKGYLE